MDNKMKNQKGEKMMDGIGENIKKILLAGIGAVATTTEKSKELLDEMVKKGELTVEQGKVLNEELKHNIKKTMEEKVNVSVKVSDPEELDELLDKMTPEQIAQLKERLRQIEETDDVAEAKNDVTEETDDAAKIKEDVVQAEEEKADE